MKIPKHKLLFSKLQHNKLILAFLSIHTELLFKCFWFYSTKIKYTGCIDLT